MPNERRLKDMTMITRWEPFRELSSLQERMNRLFQDSFGTNAANRAGESLMKRRVRACR